jgi:hypothetical protein
MRRLLLFASSILLVAPVAGATPPGVNGRIVFLRLAFQNSPLTGGLWVTAPGRARRSG